MPPYSVLELSTESLPNGLPKQMTQGKDIYWLISLYHSYLPSPLFKYILADFLKNSFRLCFYLFTYYKEGKLIFFFTLLFLSLTKAHTSRAGLPLTI